MGFARGRRHLAGLDRRIPRLPSPGRHHPLTGEANMATARKAYRGPAMEGPIASWYTRITRRDRGYTALADAIASRVRPGARVLEVAPGPGYLAIELARRGLRVSGVD